MKSKYMESIRDKSSVRILYGTETPRGLSQIKTDEIDSGSIPDKNLEMKLLCLEPALILKVLKKHGCWISAICFFAFILASSFQGIEIVNI